MFTWACEGIAAVGPPGLVMDDVESIDDVGAVLEQASTALYDRGDLQDGRRLFAGAAELARSGGNAERLASAAVGLGGLRVHEHRSSTGSALLRVTLTEALAGVDVESALGLRLRARLAAEAEYPAGRHDTVLEVAAAARRLGDPLAIADAANVAHHCLLGPGHDEPRRDLARELIEQSTRTRRRSDRLLGMLWQTVDLFLDGDPHAERSLNELRAELDERDHLAVGFVVDAIDVMRAVRSGRLDEAEIMADTCRKRGDAAGDADAEAWHAVQLLNIRWYQGSVGDLTPMLAELVHAPALSTVDNSLFAGLAAAAAAAGDRRTAAGALAALCRGGLARLPQSSGWLATMNGVIEAAHLLGQARVAEQAYALLLPFARLPMTASLAVACFGSAHHALGTAAETFGDLDRAVDHFEAAIQHNLAFSHWPAAAASRARYAQALTLRGGGSDHQTARAQLALAEAAANTGFTAADRSDAAADGADGDGEATTRTATCLRRGQHWLIAWAGRQILLEPSVGIAHLAVLLNNPGSEIACLDLVRGFDVVSRKRAMSTSPQPVLDRSAVRSYRERIAQLALQLRDSTEAGDDDGAATAQDEYEWLRRELSAATAIGGGSRAFPDSAERARTAVGKAIRRVLIRIELVDTDLAHHLRHTVRTGVTCSYRPA